MNTYKQLLIDYISGDSQIVKMEGIYELDELTDSFISRLNPDQYFTTETTMLYLEFLEHNMSDENKHYFTLEFDEWRYIEQLELMIKSLACQNFYLS